MKKRKIAMVAATMSLEEAEQKDDLFWANTTVAERLNCLYDLRQTFFL